jgi:hypothetical protein
MNLRTRLKQLETAINNGVGLINEVHWVIIDRLPDDGLPSKVIWKIAPDGVETIEVYDS